MTEMIVLDANLSERHRETLPGTPSRARVSPDGRIVNWTLFVTGDSYAATGFSTRSGLYEVETGRLVKTVEELAVFVDGKPVLRLGRELLGYHFRCRRQPFLRDDGEQGEDVPDRGRLPRRIEGPRSLENVECPSLSPDGRRIAYKQKNPDGVWRLAVLDLTTRAVTHPAEAPATIDDQPRLAGQQHPSLSDPELEQHPRPLVRRPHHSRQAPHPTSDHPLFRLAHRILFSSTVRIRPLSGTAADHPACDRG